MAIAIPQHTHIRSSRQGFQEHGRQSPGSPSWPERLVALACGSWNAGLSELSEQDRRALGRVRLVGVLVLGVTLLLLAAVSLLFHQMIGGLNVPWLALGLAGAYLVSAEATARSMARYLRSRGEAQRAARLAGAVLTARTLQHHLNNDLALTVGYCELLSTRGADGATAQVWAGEALQGARQAVRMLEALQRLTHLEEDASLGEAMITLTSAEHPAECAS